MPSHQQGHDNAFPPAPSMVANDTIPPRANPDSPSAFVQRRGEIYDEMHKQLVRFIYQYVHNWSDAEDIASNTFVKAWSAIEKLPDAESIQRFLYSCAKKNAFTWLRDNRQRRILDISAPVESADPRIPSFDEQAAIDDITRRAMSALSPRERASLLLDWQGFSDQEIGRVLGIKRPADLLRRARDRYLTAYAREHLAE